MGRFGLLLVWSLLIFGRPASARDPVLHEYVPPPGQEANVLPPEGRLPASIQAEDRSLAQPPPAMTQALGERIIGRGLRPDRPKAVELDRRTRREGVLRYAAEFNPSVAPFKRMTSLDRVEPGYRLAVRDETLRAEPLAVGLSPPDRDLFWGSLLLSVEAGRPVPIPSVAPEARILRYRSTPSARLSFFRDSADNLWARADRSGPLRLVFLTDAPRHYFAAQIPPLVKAVDVPGPLRPVLPPEVKRAASRVLSRLQVRRNETVLRQLDRLVAYFRSFQAGALAEGGSGDTYLDIALSQRGVCRHRAFAFVVTAQALGIPARYVQNEAHAFTEVFVPRMGWARIDLGGDSEELRVQNAVDKAVHDPGPDPFPRPSRYGSSRGQLAGRMTGLSPGQRLRRRAAGVSLRAYDRSGAAASGEAESRGRSRGQTAVAAQPNIAADGEDEPGSSEPAPTAKRPTEIVLFSPTRVAYRGERVEVWGRVSSEGRGVEGLTLEIYLSRDGKTGEALLGRLASGPEGRFRAALPVPRGVEVGDYRVFAVTAGDAAHDTALSR